MSKQDKDVGGGAAGDQLPDVGGGGGLTKDLADLGRAAEGLDAGTTASVELPDYSVFTDGLADNLTPLMEAPAMAEFRGAFIGRMELLLTSLESEELARILQRNPDADDLGRRLLDAEGVLPEFDGVKSMVEEGIAWADAAFEYLENEVGNEGVLRRFAQAVAERMGAVAGWTARHRRGLMGTVAVTAAVAGGYTQRDVIGAKLDEIKEGCSSDDDDATTSRPPVAPADCIVTSNPAAGVMIPEWASEIRGDEVAVAIRRSGSRFEVAGWGIVPNATLTGDTLTVSGQCATKAGEKFVSVVVDDVSGLSEGKIEVVRIAE